MINPAIKNVLVIEDDHTFRYSFGQQLKQEGWEVHEAENGVAGLELSRLVRPPLIFLDLQMPDPDGFETCAMIRSEDWARETIIVAASGMSRYSVEERALRSGFDLYLLKPFTDNLVRKILEQTASAAQLA
jgi:CheY-like chemotaxis protein